MAGYQSTLFAPTSPSLAPLACAARVDLGQGAWIDHLPNWVGDAHAVFDALVSEVPWRAERRAMYDRVVDVPRLVRWYAEGVPLPHPVLAECRQHLSDHYLPHLGEPLVTAGMCYYRDGSDSVAWHGDNIKGGHPLNTVVAIVSFGAERALNLRPCGGGESLRVPMAHGDLVVMGGSTQRTWEHAVLKTTRRVGPRFSVQFRPAGVF